MNSQNKKHPVGITNLPQPIEFLAGIVLIMSASIFGYLYFEKTGVIWLAIGSTITIFFVLKSALRYFELVETDYISKAENDAESVAILLFFMRYVTNYLEESTRKIEKKQLANQEIYTPKPGSKPFKLMKQRWEIIKSLDDAGMLHSQMIAHLECYYPELKCKEDTLRSTIRAGRAGKLD